jgi:hypothetical protein
MASIEQETLECLNQWPADSQAAMLWPFGATSALPEPVAECVVRWLGLSVRALRLTSQAARVFIDKRLQSVTLRSAAQIADLAAAAPRLAAVRKLRVETRCASDVAALAAALPSLGQHCRIEVLEVTHDSASGQLNLVGLRLPKALWRLRTLEVFVWRQAEGSHAAAESRAAYTAAAARLPLLERLSVVTCDAVSIDMPFRRFDAAPHLGAWPQLQVGWGDAVRGQGPPVYNFARLRGTLVVRCSCC